MKGDDNITSSASEHLLHLPQLLPLLFLLHKIIFTPIPLMKSRGSEPLQKGQVQLISTHFLSLNPAHIGPFTLTVQRPKAIKILQVILSKLF